MKLLATSMQTATTAVAQFGGKQSSGVVNTVTPQSIRAASTVVAALPILMVYPFLQKYFVVGLNVGSVKE